MIKSGLLFAKQMLTNADSERGLSINVRVVTSERSALGEVTSTGLCTVKEAVSYDPVKAGFHLRMSKSRHTQKQ